jgi:hypothetical protein
MYSVYTVVSNTCTYVVFDVVIYGIIFSCPVYLHTGDQALHMHQCSRLMHDHKNNCSTCAALSAMEIMQPFTLVRLRTRVHTRSEGISEGGRDNPSNHSIAAMYNRSSHACSSTCDSHSSRRPPGPTQEV